MTNKVKPFYIRITDDMTPQTVQDVFDKCVALGAKENEKANEDWFEKFPYFGVCAKDGTYFGIDGDAYVGAQEITIDQLDEWLGLESKAEKPSNGQDVYIAQINTLAGVESQRYFIHQYWCNSGHQNQLFELGILFTDVDKAILKTKSLLGIPHETPEQKAERERLEAAYDLYCHAKNESVYSCVIVGFKEFIGDFPAREREEYLAIVDKTNYRKQ